jgi:hypothetical protein
MNQPKLPLVLPELIHQVHCTSHDLEQAIERIKQQGGKIVAMTVEGISSYTLTVQTTQNQTKER